VSRPAPSRVESASHVSITLLDDRSVIQQVSREYDTDLSEGSGFTVAPDGVVVTATQVVQAGQDPRIYAANRVFAEYFKVKIPATSSGTR
jgi:coenzyme F420-reducing hydrogenase alpha subunit